MWFGQFDNPGWLGDAVLACVPPLALAVDALWGEPPARAHPVVWMGRALGWCSERLAPLSPRGRDIKGFWLGALAWCALAAMVSVAFWGVERLLMGSVAEKVMREAACSVLVVKLPRGVPLTERGDVEVTSKK